MVRLRSPVALQPILLLGASLVVLPLLLEEDAPWWVLLYVGFAALLAAALGLRAHAGPLLRSTRRALSRAVTVVAVVGLVLVLWVDGSVALDLLLLIVALCAVIAVSPDRRATWGFQAAIVAILCTAVVLAGWSWLVAIIVTAQVVVVVTLADGIAQRLFRIRAAEQDAHRAAERRGALLAAVRDLPRGDVQEAETAVVRTLRGLAFDAAGVARIDGDFLVEGALAGLPPLESPLRRGDGLAWRAIEEDRTIAVGDYERSPDRVPTRRGLRGLVVTPIRIDGRPVGALLGARSDPQQPRAEEVEVAEVMAAQLGGVLANQMSLERQRLLLEQAAHLDGLSQSLLEAVSEEVRDPLTVLRLGSQLLSERAAELDAVQRAGLLERVRRESDELRLVIDTILDFSRYHARRAAPQPETVTLSRVVAACGLEVEAAEEAEEGGPGTVHVDLELLIPAVGLLLASGVHEGSSRPTVTVRQADARSVLVLPRGRVGAASSVLVQLAEQLLTAAGGRLEFDDDASESRVHLVVEPDHGAAGGER